MEGRNLLVTEVTGVVLDVLQHRRTSWAFVQRCIKIVMITDVLSSNLTKKG
jgi:hypothetical protein